MLWADTQKHTFSEGSFKLELLIKLLPWKEDYAKNPIFTCTERQLEILPKTASLEPGMCAYTALCYLVQVQSKPGKAFIATLFIILNT
jgi:hypothetical protein